MRLITSVELRQINCTVEQAVNTIESYINDSKESRVQALIGFIYGFSTSAPKARTKLKTSLDC